MNLSDIKLHIVNNKSNVVLYNSFEDKALLVNIKKLAKETSCVVPIAGKNTRILKIDDGENTIFSASTVKDAIKSAKTLSSLSKMMLFNAKHLSELESTTKKNCYKDLQRLLHNLVTINAHNMQEVFSIIPQESIGRGGAAWRNEIRDCVVKDPYDTSLTMIRIAKNNIKIKHEISVFNTLIDEKPTLKKHDHMIHRVLMNSFYVFFPDFTDKNIKINIKPTSLTHTFDYETVQVALYHFIDNSTKYAAPNSDIDVTTIFDKENQRLIIRFEMNSLEIKEDEITKIYDEGYSGVHAKKNKLSGSGIGMARIADLLSINNAKIYLHENRNPSFLIEGLPYQNNTFDMIFDR
ncbi:ATP-binding protein [Aeromonas veronii]|uniref:ATP-binding protein n=1 Tax=Aeromonas veronii TaxID=654 RepID=UPI001430F36D|nr:ATP-binding protein [Aeromonas veronii]NJI09492.1 hypothetical protein [Aeromonas veronii]